MLTMKKIILGFPAVCLLLTGCAPAHINLVSRYTPSATEFERKIPVERGQTCKVVASIEDARTPEDVASGFGWKQVESKDVIAWLQSGVFSLESSQYQLVRAEPANAVAATSALMQTQQSQQTLNMSIKLRKMYIVSLTTSKNATIVMSVDLSNAQGLSIGQTYVRGTDTSVNWAGGEGETNSAFHSSLEQVLSKIDQYVADQCKSIAASNTL